MNNLVICIGRQYGSGGRKIGELLAKRLGVICYDKLLISRSAERSALCTSAIEDSDEKTVVSDLMVSGNVFADLAAMAGKFYAESEKVFEAQRDTIIEIAKKESCVIIGRCASSVLRGINADALSVFIYADDSDRIRRISENNGLDMKAAERKMHKTDHMRKRYFDFYSETLWGEKASYDIMLSSSKFGIDGTVDIIQKAVADKMKA